MFTLRRSFVLLLVCTLMASTPLGAAPSGPSQETQRHVVGNSEMEAALARSAAAEAKDREAIRTLLRDERVEQIAEGLGLEIKTADAAVSALEGSELAQLAAGARVADAALAGGQSITLTYGVIIIILLIVIIIILV